MEITYINGHRWHKTISDDPSLSFGKSNRARIRSTVRRIPETTISHVFEPLSEAFYTWFEPMYITDISGKDNPKLYDIRKPLENTEVPYFSLTIYEEGAPIGGTIFSVRDELISIAYRTYAHSWQSVSLQANPSIYAEYLICEHAHQLGKQKLSHGKDRNPYGVNANIGLAVFKLSVGCRPYLPITVPEIEVFDSNTLTSDALVLHYPNEGTLITEATLFLSPENESKYLQVTKYPDQLNVTVVERT